MKDEIKEMSKIELFLLDLKCSTEPTLTEKGKDLLLDYITNLQNENKKYDQCLTELTDNYKDLQKELTNLQEENEKLLKKSYSDDVRITKVIEEIKKRSTKEVADLYINLLQGKSDE